jgi:uncharacterized Zn finger protein
MKLLRFPSKEAVVSSPCARRLRTRCESCGEPTVVQDRVERDSVRLRCSSCAYVWRIAERRQSAREA